MARRVRERFRADLGLAVTGIAGPDADDPGHAVGLVYLGLATADEVRTRKLELGPEQPRDVIQRRAAKQALNWATARPSGELDDRRRGRGLMRSATASDQTLLSPKTLA